MSEEGVGRQVRVGRFEAARRMGEEASRAAALPGGKRPPELDEAVAVYLAVTESAQPAKAASQAKDATLPTVGGWVASLKSEGEFPRVAKVSATGVIRPLQSRRIQAT
jgi:hypothetical protein